MNKLNYFSSKTVRVANRVFLIHVMDFENGRFVSISEGENRPRLGSMFVSIATGQFLKKNNSIYSRLLCVDYAFKGTASTS